jgi:hypothetical protein
MKIHLINLKMISRPNKMLKVRTKSHKRDWKTSKSIRLEQNKAVFTKFISPKTITEKFTKEILEPKLTLFLLTLSKSNQFEP